LDRSTPRSKLTSVHKAFWTLVEDHKIAARFDPTRYGYRVGYTNTLPVWSVASSGWSAKGAITLVNVYDNHIELAQVSEPNQKAFSLTVPNPVSALRMESVEKDSYGSPSYSYDLAQKPDFTFALVSDPQYDRASNRDYLIQKASAAIDELNKLQPAMVLVAGDLVNNNLPEEWKMFNEAFGSLKVPKKVYVPGNHDVLFNYDFIESSYSSAPVKKPQYATIVEKALLKAKKDGYIGSTALYEQYTGQKPRQLVEYKDCAFITVPFLTQRADPEQIDYLRQQLEKTTGKEHVFVIAHYPSLPAFGNNLQPSLGGDAVLDMLNKYKVTGYLFGHRHRNGFRMHQNTAHVLTDNMLTLHLFHVFPDRVVIGRKRVGSPLYEKLVIPSPRTVLK
jgi:predicted phosphohydrolase